MYVVQTVDIRESLEFPQKLSLFTFTFALNAVSGTAENAQTFVHLADR
jgi:hypothetical protein